MNRSQTAQAAPAQRGPRPPGSRDWLAAAGIFLATLAAYWPVLRAGFIWDDDGHVTRAGLRSLHGLWEIWFRVGATQQYYPLLHSLFWFEHALWGDSALGYHLVNVLLHATGACLFAQVLRRLDIPGAWTAALIFAVHPVGVESVAWISEQKNTLSSLFYLLAALAYLRFDGNFEIAGDSKDAVARKSSAYFVASACFLFALGSKSVTATLPAALLLVAWWRKGALSWRRDWLPLAPWFAIAAGSALVTIWCERTQIGARGTDFGLSAAARCLLAGRVVCFYLGKLLWPTNLIFIYPRWQIDAGIWWQYLYPALVLTLLLGAFWMRRRTRSPLAVLLLFVGSLFPALGFINVYPFVFSYVADHFQYLADFGVIAAAAAFGSELGDRFLGPRRIVVAPFLVASLAIPLGILTWRQARTYRDVETFYRTILARNPACWLAEDNLGVVLANTGRLAEAMVHYNAALQLNAKFPQTYNNLGNALARGRRWPEAYVAYQRALTLRPGFFEAEYDWGNALSDAGLYGEALAHFEAAVRLQPDYPEAQYGWANALANQGQFDLAMPHYLEALRLRPAYPEARANYGLALVSAGQPAEAVRQLEAALRLRPDYAEAHAYLGLALARAGRLPEAVAEYQASLRLNPDDADTHRQLALALRALGRTEEALRELELAERLPSP